MDWQQAKKSMRLIRLQIEVALFHFFEWIKVIYRYYGNSTFALLDLTVLSLSFWYNPFRLCRLYKEKRQKEGEKDLEHYTYGETPLTTIDQIFTSFNIQKGSRLLEMGAGRGRLSFFLSQVKGMEVTGVENVPPPLPDSNESL